MTTATKKNFNFRILDQEKMDQIHEASIHLMEQIGQRIGGQRALKLFQDHGAAVSPDGLVKIDEDLCISCGMCQTNCPHDAIIHVVDRDKYQKCDLCSGIESGPLCVEVCPVYAIVLK